MPDPEKPSAEKTPDYEGVETRQWRRNARQVKVELENGCPRLKKRIQLFCKRFGFKQQDVSCRIETDPMFSAHFAKEPRRTGLHENLAKEWIKQLDLVRDFQSLPKSGENAHFITSDGAIARGMTRPPTKSLDFSWKTGDFIFYATHKYIKEGGGHQDGSFMEVKDAMKLFQNAGANRREVFIAILDGPYFTAKKFSEINRFSRGDGSQPPWSWAIAIGELPDLLKSVI